MNSQSIHLLYGQNIMSTLQSEIAYTYNQNEESIIGLQVFWRKLFATTVWHSELARSGILTKDTTLHWNELVGHAGLQQPQFSAENNTVTLRCLPRIMLNGLTGQDWRQNCCPTGIFFSQTYLLCSRSKSKQHIYPHWAQNLLLQHKGILNQYTANQFWPVVQCTCRFSTNHSVKSATDSLIQQCRSQ